MKSIKRKNYKTATAEQRIAYNFKVDYVPIPWPPIGRVESGLLTLSNEK